jgi:membrane fusion protein, multidrug efflux system
MGFRHLIFLIGGAVVIAILVVAARHVGTGQPTAADPPVPVTAATAIQQDVPDLVYAIGTIQSQNIVAVQARVTGTITKVEFTPGTDVKQGQELFLIDPRPYQAALDQAKAQLARDQGVLGQAQMDLARFQMLVPNQAIARQQADDQAWIVKQDAATVQLDQANVDAAQLNLEYCHITTPISGRAGMLLIDLGNFVGPQTGGQTSTTGVASATNAQTYGQTSIGSSLVSITQMQPIYVNFNVPQIRFSEIQHNQAIAPLEVDAVSQDGKLLEKGLLTVIDNQINTSTGTITMQATFPNADEALWPGAFVRVQLLVSTLKNVVTVPMPAVMAGPNGDFVYVIGSDEKVKRVAVEVTMRQNGVAVISKGLSGNEKVVTDGQYRLDDGTTVVVRSTTAVPAGGELRASE